MKAINIIHKPISYLLSFIFLIVLSSCAKKTERVAITSRISVELPVNFKMKTKKSINTNISGSGLKKESEQDNYKARINEDEISIGRTFTDEFDSLSLDQKKEKMESILKGYSKVFNGSELKIEEILENEAVECDFEFVSNIKDSVFIVFGRLIAQDTNILIFNYKTTKPAKKGSIREKDNFFKSIQFNPY